MDARLEGLDLSSFSGVVSLGRLGAPPEVRASGFADRRWSIPNEPSTVFGLASGTKGFTAVTVMALVEAGAVELSTPVRTILGDDLPLIDDRVTVRHLLGHRSGIGDYVDESVIESVADHILDVPVHQLDGTEPYLQVLDGNPQVFEPGQRFEYNNSGFVVLALIAERVGGERFEQLVNRHVLGPAGLASTRFQRMDSLPPGTATGYLFSDPAELRTNELHLPVIGSGDGGCFSTAADIHRFWDAFLAGRLVSADAVDAMVERRDNDRYGLGFWLSERGTVRLEGHDAGVSFVSEVNRSDGTVWAVLSNTPKDAWPIAAQLQGTAPT